MSHRNRRHLVEPLKQPIPTLCFQTSLLILTRYWRSTHVGLQVTDLENQFQSAADVKSLGQTMSKGMLTKEEARVVAEGYGFGSEYVEQTPDGFWTALVKHGPFAYFGNLAGSRYQHTLVIVGMKEDRGLWTLEFIDPGEGKQNHLEFFNFFRSYLPYDTIGSKTRVYYTSPNMQPGMDQTRRSD